MRRLRVFLDANVIVNSMLRDVFLTAAELGLINVRFSADVLEETGRALHRKLGIDQRKVNSLLDAIVRAFPDGNVTGYSHLIGMLGLPDPDDEHVLAAAVHGECDLLVTFNRKHFPSDALDQVDILVVNPDDAIVQLGNDFGAGLVGVIERIAERLVRPRRSVEDLVARIGRDAPTGAAVLGARFGLSGYDKLLQDMILASDARSPQAAALRLVDAVLARDTATVTELVDTRFARELTGRTKPTSRQVLDVLATVFADVTTREDWGVGSAVRTHDADVELVKFMNMGGGPRLLTEPAWRYGHLLYMRLDEGAWSLVGLDGPDPGLADVVRPDPQD